ncbi:MAG: hypothetical protein E7158_05065 [Firmicutes bacterium]|nr:hypothetical protein [Bacillota bacterium]
MDKTTCETKCKYYEIIDDTDYKRKNIDLNEYGLNKYEGNFNDYLNYNPKNDTNCVKRLIKR